MPFSKNALTFQLSFTGLPAIELALHISLLEPKNLPRFKMTQILQ
jgi:hypothetical protein